MPRLCELVSCFPAYHYFIFANGDIDVCLETEDEKVVYELKYIINNSPCHYDHPANLNSLCHHRITSSRCWIEGHNSQSVNTTVIVHINESH